MSGDWYQVPLRDTILLSISNMPELWRDVYLVSSVEVNPLSGFVKRLGRIKKEKNLSGVHGKKLE